MSGSVWGSQVVKTSTISVLLTLLASMGEQPEYNFGLALLGVFLPHLGGSNSPPFLTSLLFVLLPVTIILDITWCGIYGPDLSSGAPLFSLIMTVLNLFLKLPWAYHAFEFMNETQGNPIMVLNPELLTFNPEGHQPIADI